MIQKLDQSISAKKANIYLGLLIFLLVLLGFNNSFIQDDAFISFRYAENLVSGEGLTWNAGEVDKVEGYTNFLWVILIAFFQKIGVELVLASKIMGLVCGAGTLFFVHKLVFMILRSNVIALLAIYLLGTNYTFSSYMTGGLETQLHTFLVTASLYLGLYFFENKKYDELFKASLLSVLFALAIMTRLDSGIFCGILYVAILFGLYGKENLAGKKFSFLVALSLPGFLMLGAWFLFKLKYYGDIFPNTYYVKMDSFTKASIHRGFWFLLLFFRNYFLIPFMLIALYLYRKVISHKSLAIMLLMIGLWIVYVLRVGGGFMEFRLLVPIIPLIFIIVSSIIFYTRNTNAQILLIVLISIGAVYHPWTFNTTYGIESVESLNDRIVGVFSDWANIGRTLGKTFGEAKSPVTIAVGAAGAIPYYSKLQTVDMLGLNDKWVAKNGHRIIDKPGHRCRAPFEYLLKRKVNLVIGHPLVAPQYYPPVNSIMAFWHRSVPLKISMIPEDAKVIELPLESGCKVYMLYLTQHDYIDEKIKSLGLKTNPLKLPEPKKK